MKTYILVANDPGVGGLVEQAATWGQPVVAVVVGSKDLTQVAACPGVDEVIWLGDPGNHGIEAFASSVAAIVADDPGVVLAGRRPSERVFLGTVAASIMAPIITGVQSVSFNNETVVIKHGIYGGIAVATTQFEGPIAMQIDGGAPVVGGGTAVIETRSATPTTITVTSLTPPEVASVDLDTASRVVGVGRGLKRSEDLGLVEALATRLNAEIGCSRPLSEGLDWLPRDRYIGVSGAHIAPDLYIMIGISGQLQHVSGCRASKVIVSINNDKDALVTQDSDYILTGDLYALVPALSAALEKS
ncbi:MAG: electron transfer flavoprotein subunit alpha/FixB family protein [Propionibacteriaceae bacterium]|jgi:electron transfer flavoprotein alpha subunit|nr:electron transfer flavoprotein subunit alpha/FixB family protein [Propionibacteriaceae bacterium]